MYPNGWKISRNIIRRIPGMKKMLSILMVLMMVLSMISLAGAEALPVA
jgi:hypothetical protein